MCSWRELSDYKHRFPYIPYIPHILFSSHLTVLIDAITHIFPHIIGLLTEQFSKPTLGNIDNAINYITISLVLKAVMPPKSRFELWCNFGRPTWSLAFEKNIFYMHAITKFQKGPHIEIQNNFKNMFHFVAQTVYE